MPVFLNSWQAPGCGWTLEYLWRSTDWLIRGDLALALLTLMLVNAAAIVCHRFYRYSQARKQSRAFVRDAASALREGDFREVTKIARRNRLSHVASVVAAGLAAFASAPPHFTDGEAIHTAERAFQRRHQILAAELRLGLATLTTIASTASFIGLLGTVFGILGAFRGVAMAKATLIALVESTLALALVTTAAGLDVAIPAVWYRNHFCDRLEGFESEMSNAALETVSYLAAHPQWRSQPGHSADQLFWRGAVLPQALGKCRTTTTLASL